MAKYFDSLAIQLYFFFFFFFVLICMLNFVSIRCYLLFNLQNYFFTYNSKLQKLEIKYFIDDKTINFFIF